MGRRVGNGAFAVAHAPMVRRMSAWAKSKTILPTLRKPITGRSFDDNLDLLAGLDVVGGIEPVEHAEALDLAVD